MNVLEAVAKEQIRTDLPKLLIGDTVKVVDGIFNGYSGVLQSISDDKKQLVILVSTEKRDFPIMVDAKVVRAAE